MSTTTTRLRQPPALSSTSTRRWIAPSDVNLTAFEMRLLTTCRTRSASKLAKAGTDASIATVRTRRFSSAALRNISTTVATSSASDAGAARRSKRPASIFAWSSTSSTIAFRVEVDFIRIFARSRVAAGSGSSRSNCAMP